MLMLLVLCSLFISSFCASVEVSAVSSTDDSLTAIKYSVTPTATSFVAIGTYAKVNRDSSSSQGSIDASAQYDARKLSLQTPGPSNNNDLGFYYGALDVSASATWTPNSAVAANVKGALAQLGVSFQSIFVYYNRDAQAGFQWNNVDDDIFSCSGTETFDCVDQQGTITLKTGLDWGNLNYLPVQDCPTPTDSTVAYTSDCKVYSAEISGYVKGTGTSGTHVVTFTFYVANQPVLINGNELPTGHAKIDVNITYPWGQTTLGGTTFSGAQPKIGLSVLAAGQFTGGTYQGNATVVKDQNGYQWGSAQYSTTFYVKPQASVDNSQNAQVYTGTFTGDEVIAGTTNCTNIISDCIRSSSDCFTCGLRYQAQVYNAFGWNTRILYYSWDNDQPTQVYWDPTLALDNTNGASTPSPTPSPNAGPASSSTSVYASALLLVAAVLAMIM